MTPEGIEFTEKEWVPALRSGKYRQGAGNLEYNNTFCCLGVACHLLTNKLNLNRTTGMYSVQYNGASVYMPDVVAEYLGIDKGRIVNGRIEPGLTEFYLSDLNDKKQLSFNAIADFLEGMISEMKAEMTV